jgi:hypothetical protein
MKSCLRGSVVQGFNQVIDYNLCNPWIFPRLALIAPSFNLCLGGDLSVVFSNEMALHKRSETPKALANFSLSGLLQPWERIGVSSV